ncbi:unnamed protein product [Caenorhabditis sp. 36 PRJEB53466]|nr:unnamed protein product [Caenorhabditis sp. 36 PRJEB53466]
MPRGDQKLYVGNLPSDVREQEVEDIFTKYGRIKNVSIKSGRSGPAFAFVEFEDNRDAEDALHGRSGYEFDGKRITVEFTRGVGPRGPGGRPINDSRGGGGGGGRGFGGGNGGGRPQKGTGHRVIVEGLPETGSWQDLKDHMREAGNICYADVARDGTGIVEFVNYEDVKYAIRKLDDTKFRSHKGDTAYIRVREDSSAGGKKTSRDRSRSRSRSRTRSRSPVRRASPSRSRSRSPRDRASPKRRSPSRSRSRSASRSPVRSRSASRDPSRSPSPQ